MTDKALREHVVNFLRGRGAHADFDRVIGDLPADARGTKPDGIPYTPWSILEHMRIAQWDILEFSRNPNHVSPEFPKGYWPVSETPPDERAWDESVAAFHADLQAMIDLVADPSSDLFTPFPHGDGQTLLREALLVADHNAFHLGELVVVRRLLGCW